VKVRFVSFVDPIVTAVWPQVECHGLAEGDGGKSGSMGADILESLHSPATTTSKVNNTVDLAAVFTSIHKGLDSVLIHSPSVNLLNLGTELPVSSPAASPNDFAFHNSLNSILVDCSGVMLGAAHPASTRPGHLDGFLEPHRVGVDRTLVSSLPGGDHDDRLDASATLATADNNSQDLGDTGTRSAENAQLQSPLKTHSLKTQKFSIQLLDTQRTASSSFIPNQQPSDFISPSVMPRSLLNSELVPAAPSCDIPDASNNRLDDFILSITEAPEPPLIRTQPSSSLVPNFLVEGGSAQSVYDVGVTPSSIGKRSSARLVAKKKLKIGRNRNAIVKAQEILVAKLNNSASSHFQNSKASFSNDQVDLVEQLARHFSRPLTKEQMEAIMELATQGKEKEGIKKKGSKVTPLQAPIIEASEMR
jgi:molybdopterin-binding protein